MESVRLPGILNQGLKAFVQYARQLSADTACAWRMVFWHDTFDLEVLVRTVPTLHLIMDPFERDRLIKGFRPFVSGMPRRP